MNIGQRRKALTHQAVAVIFLAALLGVWVLPIQAAQINAPFTVNINLQTNNSALKNAGICLSRSTPLIGAFGASMTVVCATGAIAGFSSKPGDLPWTMKQDSYYRVVTRVFEEGKLWGTIDTYTGGTVTSWRMISQAHRDYLEMMVHW